MVGFAGEITSDTGTGEITVSKAEPTAGPKLAATFVVPTNRLAARPVEFTTATVGVDEVQVADCVTSWVELSLKVAMAVNCSL
jgi:hypothetical protein